MAEPQSGGWQDIAQELVGKTIAKIHNARDWHELAMKFTDGSRLLSFPAEGGGLGWCFKRPDGSVVETEPGPDLDW